MNKFELAQTQEERDEKIEFYRQRLIEGGIKDSYQIESLLAYHKEEEKNDFGLENIFPILEESDYQKVVALFEQRDQLIEQSSKYYAELMELRKRITDINSQLIPINQSICTIQGHRLYDTLECDQDLDCHKHITGEYYYRTCLVCGAKVFKESLSKEDVVVKMKKPKQDNKHYMYF